MIVLFKDGFVQFFQFNIYKDFINFSISDIYTKGSWGKIWKTYHVARKFLRLLHPPSAKKQKKMFPQKKIPQKFNMSLTSELSKVSPDYEIHRPTHNCPFWHPVWIFAIFWILPVLWRFFANCAKFAIFPNLPFSPKSPLSKGPDDFSPFLPNLTFSPK